MWASFITLSLSISLSLQHSLTLTLSHFHFHSPSLSLKLVGVKKKWGRKEAPCVLRRPYLSWASKFFEKKKKPISMTFLAAIGRNTHNDIVLLNGRAYCSDILIPKSLHQNTGTVNVHTITFEGFVNLGSCKHPAYFLKNVRTLDFNVRTSRKTFKRYFIYVQTLVE